MKSPVKKTKSIRSVKDSLLRYFLAVSIISSVFIVSNCDLLTNILDHNRPVGGRQPEFGGSQSASLATSLFVAVAEDAAGQYGAGSTVGWALSAIGLGDASGPDYTAQLDKIDQDLQEISSQLSTIQTELTNIYNELTIINCADWSQDVLNARSSIDNRMTDYVTMVNTARDTLNPPGLVSISDISSWVSHVLGDSTVLGPNDVTMETALANIEDAMLAGTTGGIISACTQSIPAPADNSFGTDTVYYNQVKLLVNYFYTYQVQALMLYSEAKHFRAWQMAGAPNSDIYSADSISQVCSKPTLICNQVATKTNTLYNNLVNQFTEGGAPYSDENLVMMYNSSSDSYLWPLSLEDFTVGAGDNCADPLTEDHPCGITAGYYDSPSPSSVVYKGYSGWSNAASAQLTQLLSGWTDGLAGDYLGSKLGFKNMARKIVISSDYVSISLNESGSTQYVVPFFDTGLKYSDLGGGPAITTIQFQEDLLIKTRSVGSLCKGLSTYYDNVNYNSKLPSTANPFYDAVGHARHCGSNYTTPFSFSVIPGWLAKQDNKANHEPAAIQYHWPILSVDKLTCTQGRSHKNAGGIPTMCGDDLTAFIEYYVPRPVTCNNTDATPCNVSASTVANAKSIFGNNAKWKRSL